MTLHTVEPLDEEGRWRARDVTYWRGRWEKLQPLIPEFTLRDFRVADNTPPNPHYKSVIRLPKTLFEQPIPVGIVSQNYTLAQHWDVADSCFAAIRAAGIKTDQLRCELGLTALGEWMNLRVYFPESFQHIPPDGAPLDLRLECFNSVDGSSRLVIFLGWLRFVCSNGMVIGETKTEFKDVHDKNMDLAEIPKVVANGLELVQQDIARLKGWAAQEVPLKRVESWVNGAVSRAWGRKAACRIYYVCATGQDVEITDPFAKGEATEKPVKVLQDVPGAPKRARTLYDVSQALSWVATRRKNPDERVEWQAGVPRLVEQLARTA